MFKPVGIQASDLYADIEYVVYENPRGGMTLLGERPIGQMYAADDAGHNGGAYIVGFDNHTNIGVLVFEDSVQDAIDAAADYIDDRYPNFFLGSEDIEEYENEQGDLEGVEHVGGYDKYARSDEITVFEVFPPPPAAP